MSLPFNEHIANGICVIPVGIDKRPTIGSWKAYQTRLPTTTEIAAWGEQTGIAIVAGAISGNLVCVDVDTKHDSQNTVFQEIAETLKEWGYPELLQKCVIEQTPSGGWHILFHSPFVVGCEKLARDKGKIEAMIETKGEGGYFVCAPTPGWELKHGSLHEIPSLSDTEVNAILGVCWALDRNEPEIDTTPIQTESRQTARNTATSQDKTPLDDFTERTSFDDVEALLSEAGWRRTGVRGLNIHLCRPGKGGRDTSATLHMEKKVFFVHTSSTEFVAAKGYGPAGVYAILKHRGNFSEAAKDLLAQGYGKRQEYQQGTSQPKSTYSEPQAKIETGVKISTASTLAEEILELYHKPYYPGESTGWREMDKIFKIEKGQMNILFGIPSHGKSSFMDALMANVVFACNWNALIFSPENKSPAYHASKLCEILTGKPMYGQGRMTPDEVLKSGAKVAERFTFLTQADGGTTLDEILEQVRIRKPDIVVVDPWNRIMHNRDGNATETEYIGAALAKTSALAKNLNISFWYVVHPQKLRRDKNGEIIRPGFYEVSGSAHWANMADNGILVYRDFVEDLTEIETVKVRYRHNGKVGVAKMKFDRPSGRFKDITEGEDFTHGVEDYKSRAGGDSF